MLLSHPSASRGRLLVSIALAVAASGCDLKAPEYVRPDLPQKDSWQNAAQQPVSARTTIDPQWWRGFRSPDLDKYIATAIDDNADLSVMAARIEVASAGIDQASAAGKPTVLAGAGLDVNTFTQPGLTRTSQQYSAAATLDWELDIWGKFAKGVEAQEAEVAATQADWRAGYLTLVSDVATAFFAIRRLDEQIAQQRTAVRRNKAILSIYETRYSEGLVPRTALLQQEAEVKGLTQQELELKRLREITVNSLATLIGVPAGNLRIPEGSLTRSVNLLQVPAGLPSDLLSRRPDIVAAEYRALSQVKLVGQARLAQLPSIGLTARGGTASAALSNLLKAWTFGLSPSVSLPMFDPNVKAQIKVSEAEMKLVEAQYRSVVIKAFEEVESALVTLHSRKQQRKELLDRLANLGEVAKLNRTQVEAGVISQLDLLESERSIVAVEQEVLQNYFQILTDTVLLYKALGGGWSATRVAASG
ncbi:efflux transporter outer membrane subunit [Thiorhodococcus mannitoliphagus]|uniref:Efflux transporter outer membrane subunit n=1 Tax=Thiorhodococcus mannitoliphagus TaxID=329406 RepID=A0A6P1DZZ2_9GAMM|nr:efflux transporter outer membrane subunit [Thiorhodococcus mannitoliphagus]NEX21732.1 efflux transporter outer membrane subunit [Thiorhodococcus mannitoliphagus]